MIKGNIQEKIDAFLLAEQALRATRESSHKWRPSLMGSCLRRHFWAKNGEPESNPTDARGLRVFQSGKLFHDWVQAYYPIEQKEVLIEDKFVKGFADIVGDNEVCDLKSQHSDSFWYMLRNVVCTLDNGKEVRFAEGDIVERDGCEQVYYYKKWQKVIKKEVLSILDEKINNWLQVAWYARKLNKEFCRLVFISKDDLCIQEYVIERKKIDDLLDKELELLYNTTTLPEGKPRLYGGKECSFCSWLDKCKGEKCKTSTQ